MSRDLFSLMVLATNLPLWNSCYSITVILITVGTCGKEIKCFIMNQLYFNTQPSSADCKINLTCTTHLHTINPIHFSSNFNTYLLFSTFCCSETIQLVRWRLFQPAFVIQIVYCKFIWHNMYLQVLFFIIIIMKMWNKMYGKMRNKIILSN